MPVLQDESNYQKTLSKEIRQEFAADDKRYCMQMFKNQGISLQKSKRARIEYIKCVNSNKQTKLIAKSSHKIAWAIGTLTLLIGLKYVSDLYAPPQFGSKDNEYSTLNGKGKLSRLTRFVRLNIISELRRPIASEIRALEGLKKQVVCTIEATKLCLIG